LHFIATDPNVRNENRIFHFNNYLFDKNVIFSRERLPHLLDGLDVLPKSYSLSGGLPDDKYVLSVENGEWHVYYSEMGSKNNEKIFNSENEACRYFMWTIALDPSVRK